MKSTLAALLSTLALAGVVIVYLEVDRLSQEVRSLARAGTEERTGASVRRAPVTPAGVMGARRESSAENTHGGPSSGSRKDAMGGAADRGAQATVLERIARLEQAEQARRAHRGLPTPTPFRFPRYARTVDDLARSLRLTPTQADRVRDAIDRGRRRVEAILKIPDETGRSPFERREEQRRRIREAVKSGEHGDVLKLAQEMRSAHQRPIPGRDATYAQEVARVRRETREEIGASLDQKQRKEFAETNIDGLVGGPGGGPVAVSVLRTGPADGDEGVFVSTGVSEINVEGDGEPADADQGRRGGGTGPNAGHSAKDDPTDDAD